MRSPCITSIRDNSPKNILVGVGYLKHKKLKKQLENMELRTQRGIPWPPHPPPCQEISKHLEPGALHGTTAPARSHKGNVPSPRGDRHNGTEGLADNVQSFFICPRLSPGWLHPRDFKFCLLENVWHGMFYVLNHHPLSSATARNGWPLFPLPYHSIA